jgi:hypothetical protein
MSKEQTTSYATLVTDALNTRGESMRRKCVNSGQNYMARINGSIWILHYDAVRRDFTHAEGHARHGGPLVKVNICMVFGQYQSDGIEAITA